LALPAATVLLVDDDPLVRASAYESLEALGLRIVVASSASEALAKVLDTDIAIVDYAMPEMTGAELVPKIRQRVPGLRVLFVTGYADQTELAAAIAAGEAVLIGSRRSVTRSPSFSQQPRLRRVYRCLSYTDGNSTRRFGRRCSLELDR
jgi:CheY-like chemotaxis protein